MESPTAHKDNEIGLTAKERRQWTIGIVLGLLLGVVPGLILIAFKPPRSNRKTFSCTAVSLAVVALMILGDTTSELTVSSTTSNGQGESQSSVSRPYGLQIDDSDLADALILKNCEVMKVQLYLITMASGSQMIEVSKSVSDAYSASRFVASTDLVFNWTLQLSRKFDELFLADLRTMSGEDISEVPKEFLVEASKKCGLAEEYDKAISTVEDADRDATRVLTLANNVPWYPEGFQILAAGVAGRWMSDFRCSSFAEGCWGLEVTTESGCANNLYIELTILDENGVNIGFTNDTTGPLGVGDLARLQFDSYDYGASKARIADVSCY
jgi:hypothetical protein